MAATNGHPGILSFLSLSDPTLLWLASSPGEVGIICCIPVESVGLFLFSLELPRELHISPLKCLRQVEQRAVDDPMPILEMITIFCGSQ